MSRLSVNITPIERLARIALGLTGVAWGLALLASAGGPVAVILKALLILAGVDLFVTGALGHCPLYRRLGYIPASLRRPS